MLTHFSGLNQRYTFLSLPFRIVYVNLKCNIKSTGRKHGRKAKLTDYTGKLHNIEKCLVYMDTKHTPLSN